MADKQDESPDRFEYVQCNYYVDDEDAGRPVDWLDYVVWAFLVVVVCLLLYVLAG